MGKGRLEAFSDGVLAIIITIMILELKAPLGSDVGALKEVLPAFTCYVLSFVIIGIYWTNHHHLFQAVHHVSGGALWANLHLLFWLSLIPATTAWMGATSFGVQPVAVYGAVLLCAGVAYFILVRVLLRHHERDSALAQAIGRDFKGILSVFLYAAAIALAWWSPLAACAIYVAVAIMWLVPDRRIERALAQHKP